VTDDVSLLVEFTNDKKKLYKALDSLVKKVKANEIGRSEQYSALLATLREIIVGEQRPIIIFQTDGDELGRLRVKDKQSQQEETPSLYQNLIKQYSLEDVYTTAQKTRTTIYAVIPGVKFIGVPPEKLRDAAELAHKKHLQALAEAQPTMYGAQQTQASDQYLYSLAQTHLRMQLALAGVTKLTGGWAEHLEQPEQSEGIYNRIFAGIERRYILSYYPTNAERDSKLRKVEIKVRNHPEYVVWGKKSYYAENR
ncbi:MAG TPA: hypothetical protein VEF04_06475, partial [Blastocatellia bacterium]|nr:hypothetical protein [Blastocatellia bacterium]